MLAHSSAEHPLLAKLRQETASMAHAIMQIPAEQGAFMAMLVQMQKARRTLEIGVFTGYSSLAVALALPQDGRITACDVDEKWTHIARRYWREAGVEQKITLHLAPATDTLSNLIGQGEAGTYDFAFIDADKENYDAYYEYTMKLLRPGGVILIDNVFRFHEVINEANQDNDIRVIRALNRKIAADSRVNAVMLPIADGITMVRKHFG